MLESGKLKNATQLAGALGITPQALSNYKRNGRMPAKLLFQFAELYGVSLDWLVGEASEGGTVRAEGVAANGPALGANSKEYQLTEEERVYVDKLLLILRSTNSTFKNVIMLGLDLEDRKTA
ncbi:MAG: helix-turn-helix transcriptional regulator [Proteobacteria bacterium]|nr:helix-turn-helix transcriptional regulator [Pseudomonadota bacterium]